MNDSLNILLVEDDTDDRYFFAEALEKLGIAYNLSIANNSEELFHKLESGHMFDLIFLDINIPFKNGKECLNELKNHPLYKHIPVIIFTGSSLQKDIDDAYEFGAHFYVIKPYAHINYLASIKSVLEIGWKGKPSRVPKEDFLINLTYS